MTLWFLVTVLVCAVCMALQPSSTFAASGQWAGLHYVAQASDGKPRPRDSSRGKAKGKEKSIVERVRRDFPTWRGQELNKVLREVSRRDPARGNKFLKEGLSAHEGGTHDGHTIRRHVAVSAKHLEARIEHEKQRSADRKQQTRKDHTDLKMEHISSFKSLKEANRLVEKTLTDPQNQGRLKNWAKDKSSSKQFLELTLKDAGSITGLAMDPKSKKLAEAQGVRVVLRRSNGKRGWSIVTAHPVVKAEAPGHEKVAVSGQSKHKENRLTKDDGATTKKEIQLAQKGVDRTFTTRKKGSNFKYAGKTITEVAEGLRTGRISPKEIPVEFVVIEGERYAVNNRSLLAFRRAGMQPTKVIDVTADPIKMKRVKERLREMDELRLPRDATRIRKGEPNASRID